MNYGLYITRNQRILKHISLTLIYRSDIYVSINVSFYTFKKRIDIGLLFKLINVFISRGDGVQTECRQTKCWQTKCRTDKMSNRQNVEQTKCRQTKGRTDKMSTIFFFLLFFFLQFFYAEKQCGRQFWNAVEREPIETRVLNPTASEAS